MSNEGDRSGHAPAVAVVAQKTPPGARRVLAQVALGPTACCTVFDDVIALTVRTSDRDVWHGPFLALGRSQHRPNVTSIAVDLHF